VNGRPGTKFRLKQIVPPLRERARVAGRWYESTYDLSYPRLSAASHGFDATLREFQPGEMANANALDDAVSRALAILTWACSVLGRMPEAVGTLNLMAQALSR